MESQNSGLRRNLILIGELVINRTFLGEVRHWGDKLEEEHRLLEIACSENHELQNDLRTEDLCFLQDQTVFGLGPIQEKDAERPKKDMPSKHPESSK
jgi:hypothetical protein